MTNFLYDLHIHSALSPCADNDMTPVNIVAKASALGLEIIAVSDHNSIHNVKYAMEVGEALDVVVVPAMELQTAEDIHLLCLFGTYESLAEFYGKIKFTDIKNRPDIFGDQLIIDTDDEIVGREESMLLAGSGIGEYEAARLAEKCGGIAVPAHIDRDSFGIIAILGVVPEYYKAVEVSCDKTHMYESGAGAFVLRDSDAHTLNDIGKKQNLIELPEKSAIALVECLRKLNKQ